MPRRREQSASPRRARRVSIAIAGGVLLTVVPIFVLYLADVPLGETGKFVYRYTPIPLARLLGLAAIILPGLLTLAAAASLMQPRRDVRLAGWALAAASVVGLVAWNFWAPPQFHTQHFFNFRSPSHDGAFLTEAEPIKSVPTYLQGFNQRIQGSKEKFGGTRVIANPPLMTVVFRWVTWAFPTQLSPMGTFEQWYAEAYETGQIGPADPAASMRAAVTCTAMLALAGVAALGLGRIFLSPVGAFVFAVIVTFNPMTLHFNPGKDPAQLLTVMLMLWAWFAGWRRRSWLLHGLAGATLAIGMGFGLIHLWVAIAALAGTWWQHVSLSRYSGRGRGEGSVAKGSRVSIEKGPSPYPLPEYRENIRGFLLRHLLPTVAGGVLVWLGLWIAVDWNLAATVLAVTKRWKELQPEINYNHKLWLLIGLPSVLVFVGPAIWTLAISSLRWRWGPGSFGGRLAIATCGVMAVVYFIGIPYELPRLWVVFLPPLVLGLMSLQPLARGRNYHRATALVLILLAVHLLGSALHWSLLDARESEYRLRSNRLFN